MRCTRRVILERDTVVGLEATAVEMVDGEQCRLGVFTRADPENPLEEPFQFRDLRAKSASDDTPEAAARRLGHVDPGITEKVYGRTATRVKPLR